LSLDLLEVVQVVLVQSQVGLRDGLLLGFGLAGVYFRLLLLILLNIISFLRLLGSLTFAG
jgi:hypothetical protein